ncbi:uncharacterized protein K02A2.6-like [Teleopsis dalmanni]|uniref:uncharacterized protein K02A2.6-like n=1 Tax=Teleopsis dalmanni TaxID=139649 RepID=UPI0018CDB3C0|nr:uncharacterized protein K02A2.6-like [Teleopsis dalmanni]
MANEFAKIIADQNAFMKSLLDDQKGFLQTILRGVTSSTNEADDSTFFGVCSHHRAQKESVFLTWVDGETFELLKKLFGKNDLEGIPFAELVQKLSEHFQEQIHVVAARYNFNKCLMKPTQTYREWIAELRGIARECQFQCIGENCTKSYVDEMIRDMLILHTPHDTVRAAALQKLKPTLEDVLLIAESFTSTTNATNSIKQQQLQESLPLVNEITSHAKNRAQKEKSSSVSVITQKTFNQLGRPKLRSCTRPIYGYGKKVIETLGECEIKIKCGKLEKEAVLVVAKVERPISNFKASIKSTAVQKYFKCRQVPFALLEKFNVEADRLVQNSIWKPVKFSNWASPIVLAPKQDGSIRICGDFKVTINSQIEIEGFPLPTRAQLFHKIRYVRIFSKIDLKDAYLQLELDEDSKKLVVVNTPNGLFEYQRLPYGIASAPAIFQRYLELFLQEVWHQVQTEQMQFFQNHIDYLGRRISAEGILPEPSGLTAIQNLKRPEYLKEVEALMGKINHYYNYIPIMSQIAAPINQLRKKNIRFNWTHIHEEAFKSLKKHIVNATQLVHFQEHLPIILATDASSSGIGAVISHIFADGSERPIAFASKTLNVHQVKYSQIEKEGLAIVFGIQKFHQYLYGRKFTLFTDHKPLVSIFNPGKHLPTTTSNRLQRWAIILMAYQFDIKYKPTAQHGNADALSRLPEGPDNNFDQEDNCFAVEELDTPIDAEVIRFHTKRDETLMKVHRFIQQGWPISVGPQQADILPYFQRNTALVIIDNIICLQGYSNRAIIPKKLRQRVLKLLHESHWGIVRMKQLARRYCWWPGIDKNIETLASSCNICKRTSASPPKEFSSWPEAIRPWQRVHIDFAGPVFNQHMWLVCVDAFSQYPYIVQLSNTTSTDTVKALTSIFAIEGLPETLVSDNGPQLTSSQFKEFCLKNGIQHVTTAPFHPASNGLAERFVRTFKTSVKKNLDDSMPISEAVIKFLVTYRSMPNSNNKSPAELLHGRTVRTLLTQILPVTKSSKKQPVTTKFGKDCKVFLRNYSSGPKWVEGIIEKSLGKRVYLVKTQTGQCKRHQNQLQARQSTPPQPTAYEPSKQHQQSTIDEPLEQQQQSTIKEPSQQETTQNFQETNAGQQILETPTSVRRSERTRKRVCRFQSEDFRT